MEYKQTINYKGIDFNVEYSFSAGEKQTRDNPGCAAKILYIYIYHKGVDFTEFLENEIEDIEQAIWDHNDET